MKEIKQLLERSENALRSAHLLLENGDLDGSISRSYYAMFYAAEALLLTKDLKFSSHKSVISLVGEHFVKTGILEGNLGRSLNKAFEQRIISDYSLTRQSSEEDAREVLGWAREFGEAVNAYLAADKT